MEIIQWHTCSIEEQKSLLMRPAMEDSQIITTSVADIIETVRIQGDSALQSFTRKFDGVEAMIKVDYEIINHADHNIPAPLKQAIDLAMKNIECFHQAQTTKPLCVETMPGVFCQQLIRPIQSVGLYIPGGTAPLLSTVMMLSIPARIAGCQELIVCSPPPIASEILYIAKCCHIDQIFNVGGAQAIAAMALGTETVPKVDKIFGPGNRYVTEAKRQVSQRIGGAAIDMPAGPSEVLVIADCGANPTFIAADLLSQAEHGSDSQVIFLTPDEALAHKVVCEIEHQLKTLPRAAIAQEALRKSHLIVVDSLETCVKISNQYGPEHLIIQTRAPDLVLEEIINAGSVFLGDWSPESVGDYASGTNHVLPTYGYTSTYSSLGLADFQKRMTAQQLSPEGLLNIANTVELLASAEQLMAHKNAVTVRVNALKEEK